MVSDMTIMDIQADLSTIIPIIIPAIQAVGISQATILILTITTVRVYITHTTGTTGIIKYEKGRIYCVLFSINFGTAGSGKKRLLFSSWWSHE